MLCQVAMRRLVAVLSGSRQPKTSTGQSSCAAFGPMAPEPTTNSSSITRTVAGFIQAPAQDPLVCSGTRQRWMAAVSVVYRRPIGAVATVQRVRRRLQISRLDSNSDETIHYAGAQISQGTIPCYRCPCVFQRHTDRTTTVCLSVCLMHVLESPAKTDEPIEMPFGT